MAECDHGRVTLSPPPLVSAHIRFAPSLLRWRAEHLGRDSHRIAGRDPAGRSGRTRDRFDGSPARGRPHSLITWAAKQVEITVSADPLYRTSCLPPKGS